MYVFNGSAVATADDMWIIYINRFVYGSLSLPHGSMTVIGT